ncbi:MAG TPA: hypothetical protein PKA37_03425 [Planctomycetota bacterium]|nr:hypothetical protein [Planctomycetota bacterium]
MLTRRIDELLLRGQPVDLRDLADEFDGSLEELEELVDFRRNLLDDGLGAEADGEPGDLESEAAQLSAEIQDVINRGESPDYVSYLTRHGGVAKDIESKATLDAFFHASLSAEKIPYRLRQAECAIGLGRYRLIRKLADHRLGMLFLALSEDDGAIEVFMLLPHLSDQAAWRILREADFLRQFQIPGVVPVLRVGEIPGVRSITSPHIPGRTFRDLSLTMAFNDGVVGLNRILNGGGEALIEAESPEERQEAEAKRRAAGQRLSGDREHQAACLDLIATTAEVVGRAHREGLIHGELTPDAVVVRGVGDPCVRWFAWQRIHPVTSDTRNEYLEDLAPERWSNVAGRNDWRTDLFGLASCLYFLLTLRSPSTGLRPSSEVRDTIHGAQILLGNVQELPSYLRDALLRPLSWTLEDRPMSAALWASQLREIRSTLLTT